MNRLAELYVERDRIIEEIRHRNYTAIKSNIRPYQESFASKEFLDLMGDLPKRLNAVLAEIYELEKARKGPDHFTKENVFVWGGPTPSWGGSMAKDASIKAKEYFGFDNVMYVYGDHSDEMLAIHRDCGKVICHLGSNCRTAGAQTMSDVDEAKHLSEMSLKYPNIIGGVVDDMIGNCGPKYSRKIYMEMHDALKSANPNLELYGVVYTHELDGNPMSKRLVDCIDHVILWTWDKNHLMDLDVNIEKCLRLFPGKPIMMGVFMFDYGLTCLPNDVPSIQYQLEKARKYLQEGKIQDIVILGDREIHKCPEVAVCIRDFFKNEFLKG